jgi:hypothetical protein
MQTAIQRFDRPAFAEHSERLGCRRRRADRGHREAQEAPRYPVVPSAPPQRLELPPGRKPDDAVVVAVNPRWADSDPIAKAEHHCLLESSLRSADLATDASPCEMEKGGVMTTRAVQDYLETQRHGGGRRHYRRGFRLSRRAGLFARSGSPRRAARPFVAPRWRTWHMRSLAATILILGSEPNRPSDPASSTSSRVSAASRMNTRGSGRHTRPSARRERSSLTRPR